MSGFRRKEVQGYLERRGYSERIVAIYLKQVQNFAEYFNKAPGTLTQKHIHEYQVYLVQQKQVSWICYNQNRRICEQ